MDSKLNRMGIFTVVMTSQFIFRIYSFNGQLISPRRIPLCFFNTHTHTHTHTNFLSVYVRDLRSVEDGPPPRAKRNLFSNSFLDHTWILKLCQVPSLLGSSFSPPRPHPTHIDPPNWPFGVSGQVFPSAHQFTFTSISHKGFYCTRKWIYPPWDQGSKVAPMQRASPLVVKFGNL
jgi:hypothetical protein